MPESPRTRRLRWRFNWFPAYRASGARITYIADDVREVRPRLPLNWRTRNVNGTIYGGCLYAAVDPLHAIMLAYALGPENVVAWTKQATIAFRRQARTDLTGCFTLTEAEISAVRADIERDGKAERTFTAELRDRDDQVCAACDVLVHLHCRAPREMTKSE